MTNTISVFSTYYNEPLASDKYQLYMSQLPEREQNKVKAYRRWEDATASLIGKALLIKGLVVAGYQAVKLNELQYSKYNRPFLAGGIDFSIAHSGTYVVCAIAGNCRVGIDIEQIQTQDLDHFKYTLCQGELENISTSVMPYQLFYDTWTKKEAVAKADGRGLGLNLSVIDTTASPVMLDGVEWYTQAVAVSAGYTANVAFNDSLSVVTHTIVSI